MLPVIEQALFITAHHYAPDCAACSILQPLRADNAPTPTDLDDTDVILLDLIRWDVRASAPSVRAAYHPDAAFEGLALPHMYIHHAAMFTALVAALSRAYNEDAISARADVQLILDNPPAKVALGLGDLRAAWRAWDEEYARRRRERGA